MQLHMRAMVLGEIEWVHLEKVREKVTMMQSPDFMASLYVALANLAKKPVLFSKPIDTSKSTMIVGLSSSASAKVIPETVENSNATVTGAAQQHPLTQPHEDAAYNLQDAPPRTLRSNSRIKKMVKFNKKPLFVRTNSWSQQTKKLHVSSDPTHGSRMYFKDWFCIRRIDALIYLIYKI